VVPAHTVECADGRKEGLLLLSPPPEEYLDPTSLHALDEVMTAMFDNEVLSDEMQDQVDQMVDQALDLEERLDFRWERLQNDTPCPPKGE
jgi:hypothetical protein